MHLSLEKDQEEEGGGEEEEEKQTKQLNTQVTSKVHFQIIPF